MKFTIAKQAKGVRSRTIAGKKIFYCSASLNIQLDVENKNIINVLSAKEELYPILNRFLRTRSKLKHYYSVCCNYLGDICIIWM